MILKHQRVASVAHIGLFHPPFYLSLSLQSDELIVLMKTGIVNLETSFSNALSEFQEKAPIWKLLFALFREASVKFIEKRSRVPVKGIYVKGS